MVLNTCGTEWAETNSFGTNLQNAHAETLKYLMLKHVQPSTFKELFPYCLTANLLQTGKYFSTYLQILKIYY